MSAGVIGALSNFTYSCCNRASWAVWGRAPALMSAVTPQQQTHKETAQLRGQPVELGKWAGGLVVHLGSREEPSKGFSKVFVLLSLLVVERKVEMGGGDGRRKWEEKKEEEGSQLAVPDGTRSQPTSPCIQNEVVAAQVVFSPRIALLLFCPLFLALFNPPT